MYDVVAPSTRMESPDSRMTAARYKTILNFVLRDMALGAFMGIENTILGNTCSERKNLDLLLNMFIPFCRYKAPISIH